MKLKNQNQVRPNADQVPPGTESPVYITCRCGQPVLIKVGEMTGRCSNCGAFVMR